MREDIEVPGFTGAAYIIRDRGMYLPHVTDQRGTHIGWHMEREEAVEWVRRNAGG